MYQDESKGVLAVLNRCRFALAVGAPEWETDVGAAIEGDAQLVRDIDQLIATLPP